MSLILDALRRAEAGRGRDLGQRLAQPLPPHARRIRRAQSARWLVAAAVVVGVAGWVMVSPITDRLPQPDSSAPAGNETPTRAHVDGSVRTERADSGSAPPRGSSLADIPLVAAPPAPVPAAAPPSQAPLLLQLPAEVRSTVPQLSVNAHFWSADPARRFIVLDMRRYRDGDTVRDGLRVVSVLPDGAELDWRGTRFRVTPDAR